MSKFESAMTRPGLNPRYMHTFTDEDQMSVLKGGVYPQLLDLILLLDLASHVYILHHMANPASRLVQESEP